MAEKVLKLEVVTPERNVTSVDSESLVVPAYEGYLGVLPNHAPLITSLKVGVVRFKVKGQEKKMAISGGFMEVANNHIVILADSAELAEEIDIDRARAARERAERRLKEKREEIEYMRAHLSLQRAAARLEAADDDRK